jgi:hypothetical protein
MSLKKVKEDLAAGRAAIIEKRIKVKFRDLAAKVEEYSYG